VLQTGAVSSDPRLGTSLSHYRLDEQIGRGGMGVVYLAFDQRLDRRVAVKVMASEMADDPSFRERFQREARMAAAIDHPNIIPIYDTGEEGSVLFLVMRYLQGTDLGNLLRDEGPLPEGRAVSVLGQVAGALDAAHEDGLVHRDVKPANILIAARPGPAATDRVYLTDFGLTKRFSDASNALTMTGHFVGTIDYVAPEQVQGGTIDGRADQYSLACVAFECLTGNVPFSTTSGVATLIAHIQEPPPRVTERRPDLTTQVDAALAKAMAKEPDDRFATCDAFVEALAAAMAASGGDPNRTPTVVALPPPPDKPSDKAAVPDEGPPNDGTPSKPDEQPPPPEPPGRSRKVGALIAGLIALTLVVGGVVLALNATKDSTDGGTTATGETTGTTGGKTTEPPPPCDVPESSPAHHPGVTAQVFVMGADGANQIQISKGGLGTERGAPTFSPDCSEIAFSRAVDGQRDIVFMTSDGTPAGALTDQPGDDDDPAWSPNGKRILFTSHRNGNADVFVMDADGSNPTPLADAPGVDIDPSWSSDGKQIAFVSDQEGSLQVFVMDADGSNKRSVTAPALKGVGDPALSPDGGTIVFSAPSGGGGGRQLFVVDVETQETTQLTGPGAEGGGASIGGVNAQPTFSPDGQAIVFTSTADGNENVYTMNADGSDARALTSGPDDDSDTGFSLDGTHIVFLRTPAAAQTTTTTSTAAPTACADLAVVLLDATTVTVANLGDCTADFQVTNGPAGFTPSTGSGTVAGHSQTTVTVGDGCAPDVAVKWTATVTRIVEEGSGPDANPANDSATAFPCGESPPGDF
jgi:serine/threonine protein kinase/Tol biopolymer transport system component